MQKYGDAQKANVFRGEEAAVVNEYMKKFGKPVSEFTKDEKALFDQDLKAVQPEEEPTVVLEIRDPGSGLKPLKRTTKKVPKTDA